jgi:hypothetical protein
MFPARSAFMPLAVDRLDYDVDRLGVGNIQPSPTDAYAAKPPTTRDAATSVEKAARAPIVW